LLFLLRLTITFFLLSKAPSLPRKRVCSLQCTHSLVRLTPNHTLPSHLRLCSLFVASYDSQGLRWKYSNPPPHGVCEIKRQPIYLKHFIRPTGLKTLLAICNGRLDTNDGELPRQQSGVRTTSRWRLGYETAGADECCHVIPSCPEPFPRTGVLRVKEPLLLRVDPTHQQRLFHFYCLCFLPRHSTQLPNLDGCEGEIFLSKSPLQAMMLHF
jgi:hypothetical protein